MKFYIGMLIFWAIGVLTIIYVVPGKKEEHPIVTDVKYNPKDSSWHLDIVTGKDTVEVPVNAIIAAKFIRK